jgi:hypothetical protein
MRRVPTCLGLVSRPHGADPCPIAQADARPVSEPDGRNQTQVGRPRRLTTSSGRDRDSGSEIRHLELAVWAARQKSRGR